MNFLQELKYKFQVQGLLTKIIIINVAVFLTVNLIGNLSHLDLLKYTALPLNASQFLFRFWTLFSYMFTHAGLGHLFWNMVLLYFMAQIFFTILSQKKLVYVYVMSGLSGGALMLVLGMLFPAQFENALLIGASAAVMGVGAVMAVYAPNYRVFLFGVFDMAYKYFFLVVFCVNTILDLSVNTGGKISHIGGAFFGLLYGYYLKQGVDLFKISIVPQKKSNLKVVSHNRNYSQTFSAKKGEAEQSMDELLDKISKSGYDSLSKKEKDLLFKLSQKK
jgi:membrane associated rhomboid family serine protease